MTVSQHEKYKDPETEAVFVIYTFAFLIVISQVHILQYNLRNLTKNKLHPIWKL